METVSRLETSQTLTQAIAEIIDAEPPAADDNQESQNKKAKK